NTVTGDTTLTQLRAVVHGNPADPDEAGTPAVLNPNLVGVTVTVTDGDNDTSAQTAFLNNVVKFEDDGPTAGMALKAGATLLVDESLGANAGETEGGAAGLG